jgi:lysozyme family protein
MAKAGVAPVFGSIDTSRFLWAAAWLGWGTPVATPQPGDVLVFDFGGGDHHVTLFESDNGNGTWACRGGNQSHRAMVTNFPKSKVMGIRRAAAAGAIVQPTPAPAAVKPPSKDFADCIALVLQFEGGNDDDPQDPGGRTSRGILQREWNVWRQTRPDLPSDVWQAPQDQILAIYQQKYWDALCCDSLPAGVDYAVFDYGVNSGIGRSAKVLQGFVGAQVDGEIGPQTIAATAQADAGTLVNQICDERLKFLQGLGTFQRFGRGWTTRVQGVRQGSLRMASAAPHVPPTPRPIPITPPPITPPPIPITPPYVPPTDWPVPADPFAQLRQLIERLETTMAGTTTTPQQPPAATPATPSQPSAAAAQPNLGTLIQQAMAIIQTLNAAPSQTQAATPAQPQDQVKQIVNVLNALLGAASGQPADGSKPPLGQVNGALGQTIGNLLNGNKSAIGIIGSLATSVLQSAGPSVSLQTILPFIGSTAGLGSIAMPFFLAIAAWGVLGKMEKWSQPAPPPSK